MKHNLWLLLVVLLALSSLSACTTTPTDLEASQTSTTQPNQASTQQNLVETQDWREFVSTEGGFRALFPSSGFSSPLRVPSPSMVVGTERRLGANLMGGSSYSASATKTSGGAIIEFTVQYVDATNMTTPLSAEQIDELMNYQRERLDEFHHGFYRSGTLISERNLMLDQYVGREFIFEAQGHSDDVYENYFSAWRYYWVSPRLYILYVLAPTETSSLEEIEKFFDSFKLIAPENRSD